MLLLHLQWGWYYFYFILSSELPNTQEKGEVVVHVYILSSSVEDWSASKEGVQQHDGFVTLLIQGEYFGGAFDLSLL